MNEKTALEKIRETIAVENPVIEGQDNDATKPKPDAEKPDTEPETEDPTPDPEASEGEDGEGDGEGKTTPEPELSDADKIREKMQKRIDKLTAKSRTTEDENKELRRLLDAKLKEGEVPLTEEEVERRAELKAAEKDQQRQTQLAQQEFEATCNKLAAEATKADKDFMKKVMVMGEEIGLIPPIMIGVLNDLEDDKGARTGGAVLAYLADNTDEAEKIYTMSPAKMALQLAKISDKIVAKTKTPPKPLSKVPNPNAPLGGASKANTPLNDTMSDKEWIERRQAERKAKGKI